MVVTGRGGRILSGRLGILLFFFASRAVGGCPEGRLARELAEEGDWLSCRREALRAILADCRDEQAAPWVEEARWRGEPAGGARGQETSRRPRLAAWFISFYARQIAPAIGSRCILEPSCSRYFLEAADRHGFLAIPMQGDRFVREPSVVQAAEKPLRVGGKIRFADPVSDHDWWFRKHAREPGRGRGREE